MRARVSFIVLVGWVTALGGCGGGNNGSSGGDASVRDSAGSDAAFDGTRGDRGCAELSETECTANQSRGCEPILGWMGPADDETDRRYAGCRTAGAAQSDGSAACSAMLSCGVNPQSGECWGFASSCVPDGWISSADPTQWAPNCDEVPADCPAHCHCQMEPSR